MVKVGAVSEVAAMAVVGEAVEARAPAATAEGSLEEAVEVELVALAEVACTARCHPQT